MATYKGISLEVARSSAKAVGMILVSQQVSVGVALALNDIIRFGPFPAGIKPSHSRPRAADIDAAEVGTMVSGYVMAGTLYMTIHEDYTGGGCP